MSISSRISNYFPYMERFGIIKGVKVARTLFPKEKSDKVVSFDVPGIKYPVKVRLGTTDGTNFIQNFLHEEFKLPPMKDVKLVIDTGANAGYASILFLNKFPGATVIAVEPEGSNVEALNNNCKPYPNFKSIQAGIWTSNTNLKIVNTSVGKTAFQVMETTETGPGTFPGITIDKILADSGFPKIDLLKIDIEGTEKEVFKENYKKWIDKVDVMIIELHDRIVPGCGLAFYTAMEKENFRQYALAANMVYVRNK
jgi:FkbM family methyltransferase